MQATKAGAAKDSVPSGAAQAPTKAAGSAKKSMMSGDGFEQQDQSLMPGGADQAKMAGLDCGQRGGVGDPKPYDWSVSFSRTAVMGDGERPQRANVKIEAKHKQLVLHPGGAVLMLTGHIYETADKGEGTNPEPEVFGGDVAANLARFEAAKTTAQQAHAMKGLKTKAPSAEATAPFEWCT